MRTVARPDIRPSYKADRVAEKDASILQFLGRHPSGAMTCFDNRNRRTEATNAAGVEAVDKANFFLRPCRRSGLITGGAFPMDSPTKAH